MTTNLQTVMFSGLQVFLIGFEYKMSTKNYSESFLVFNPILSITLS